MNRFIEIILALAVVGTTLAFGGVQTITFSIMEVVVFALLLVLLIKQTRDKQIQLPLPIWPILFVAFVALQLVPLPASMLEMISPPRSADLASIPGTTWAPISVYPRETWVELVKVLAYLSAFALAAYVSDLRKNPSFLVRLLILLGLVEAAYGIVQYLTGWQQIFTYVKKYDLEEATGTFINRNHFAGHLELVIPFVLAAGFHAFEKWARDPRSFRGNQETGDRTSWGWQAGFCAFLLVLLAVAMLFSRSRMGILVGLTTILLMSVLAQLKVWHKSWLLSLLGFLIVVMVYGLWIGLGPVLQRFESVADPKFMTMESRVAIWSDVLRMVRDFPLVGSGLGTFETVYRQYQTTQVNYLVDHAHNDYLEFATDTGILGAVLLFVPIFYLLGKMILAFLDDPRSYRRSVTLGCIGSTFAILSHSLTDFNLQIPANTLSLAVILGIGYRVAILDRHKEEEGWASPVSGANHGQSAAAGRPN